MIDGSTIEARSRSYGTSYASSDLTIASFGAEDGRVFAGRDGNATVTVRLGALTATADVHVESFSPTPLSFLALSGFPNGIAVSGDTAYVASGGAGLHVIDVSNLSAPVRLATLPLPGNANNVRVADGYAYIAAGTAGLRSSTCKTRRTRAWSAASTRPATPPISPCAPTGSTSPPAPPACR